MSVARLLTSQTRSCEAPHLGLMPLVVTTHPCLLIPSEFPIVLVECHSGDHVAEFHRYVRPEENPTLSDFCKDLTGNPRAEQGPASLDLRLMLRVRAGYCRC